MIKNIPLSYKLSSFLVLGLIALSTAILFFFSIINTITDLTLKEERVLNLTRAALQLDAVASKINSSVQELINTKDLSLIDEIEANRTLSFEYRTEIRRNTELPEVIEQLNKYEQLLPERTFLGDQIIKAVQENEGSTADIQNIILRRNILDDQASTFLSEIVNIEQSYFIELKEISVRTTSDAQRNVFIFSAGILVSTVILISVLIRSIIYPINIIKEKAIEISEGNFKTKLDIDRKDEIGELSKALSKMVSRISESQDQLIEKTQSLMII